MNTLPSVLNAVLKSMVVVTFIPLNVLLLVSIQRVKTLRYNPIFLLSRTQVALDICALGVVLTNDLPASIAEKNIHGRSEAEKTIVRAILSLDLDIPEAHSMVHAAFSSCVPRVSALFSHLFPVLLSKFSPQARHPGHVLHHGGFL